MTSQNEPQPKSSNSDDHFAKIYELTERQLSGYRKQVAETFKVLAAVSTALMAIIGAILYFFLGDQVSTLDQRVEGRLRSVEAQASEFLSSTKSRIDERLSNESISNRVQSKIIQESLQQATNAVKEAIASKQVTDQKNQFLEQIVSEISDNLRRQVDDEMTRQLNLGVAKRIAEIDPENEKVISEISKKYILEAVRAEIDTYKGPRGEPGPVGARGEKGEAGIPGQRGSDGTDVQFPSGAVVAFDRPGKCPSGWSPFAESQSRSIIGASFSLPDPLLRNENLRRRKYRDHGGEEVVALDTSELPGHKHFLIVGGKGDSEGMNDPDAHIASWGSMPDEKSDFSYSLFTKGGEPDQALSGDVVGVGEIESHNNMPPFIALYFCKKD